MDDDILYTKDDEIADVRMDRPHVVILGAGASRAVCPDGDKSGRSLPLMADFAACLGLDATLRGWGIDPSQNFEDTYSRLHEAGEHEKLQTLNELVEDYFGALELPDHPTIYDHLVLALRETDIIATFNWDPLLLQAYRRNPRKFGKPKLAFLHGNLLTGYCEADETTGMAGANCSRCGEPFTRTPILYPVRNKNYANSPAIVSQWELLKWGMENAFMFTIFGYSGPKTDQEAIALMSGAWGGATNRAMEQAAFITFQTESDIQEAWGDFIHTHHWEMERDFFASWIARHPRRTGEAYLAQYIDAKFVEDNPAPKGTGFPELWAWYEQFCDAEQDARP